MEEVLTLRHLQKRNRFTRIGIFSRKSDSSGRSGLGESRFQRGFISSSTDPCENGRRIAQQISKNSASNYESISPQQNLSRLPGSRLISETRWRRMVTVGSFISLPLRQVLFSSGYNEVTKRIYAESWNLMSLRKFPILRFHFQWNEVVVDFGGSFFSVISSG